MDADYVKFKRLDFVNDEASWAAEIDSYEISDIKIDLGGSKSYLLFEPSNNIGSAVLIRDRDMFEKSIRQLNETLKKVNETA